MGMHKGMCGRTGPDAPGTYTGNVHTLGNYLLKKYPEDMKTKLTFDDWIKKFYMLDERTSLAYRMAKEAWRVGQQNVGSS